MVMIKKTIKRRANKRNTLKRKYMGIHKKKLKGGAKTREDLLRIASKWIGHGTYVVETEDMIVKNNYPKSPDDEYIPYDFLILFTNYGQFDSEPVKDLYKFLHSYSAAKYADKSLAMNCWQFVLLCLLEAGYIDETHLKILYHNYVSSPVRDKGLPEYFGKMYSTPPVPGDIVVFKRKLGGNIWHIAILATITRVGDTNKYECIEMLGDKVYKSEYTEQEQDWDNLLFITPENFIEPVLSLKSDGLEVTPAKYSRSLLRNFLVNLRFKDEIFEHATEKWNQLLEHRPKPTNYELLLEELDLKGYTFIKQGLENGVDYARGIPNFYETMCKRFFLNKPEFANYILQRRGLMQFV
jgi:hypothetical protein